MQKSKKRRKKEEKEVEKEKKQEEGNALSDEEKRDNVAKLVMGNLCGISGCPGTDKTVNTFFKIINIPTADSHNGLAFDFYKVFDELFARKEVKFVDKHVGLLTSLLLGLLKLPMLRIKQFGRQ